MEIPPTPRNPNHLHFPPLILPPFGFVHVSFIDVPENPSPFPPIIPERKKELLSFATAWMKLECIMLSEISQEASILCCLGSAFHHYHLPFSEMDV